MRYFRFLLPLLAMTLVGYTLAANRPSGYTTICKLDQTCFVSCATDVAFSDFASLDLSLATAPRNADGSLPVTNLFRLNANSALIDKVAVVGLLYLGSALDLGTFEKK